MGYPGKNTKKYSTPTRRYEKARIETERVLAINYGLRNKREIWRAIEVLRKLSESVEDDECDVKPDVLLPEEVTDHSLELLAGGFLFRAFSLQSSREAEAVVQSEHDKQHRSGSHDDGPCVERCLTGSRSCCLACVDEHTGKIDEKSGSYQFGDVVVKQDEILAVVTD